MKAYLINMHLLVPRSRSSAKVKVKYKGFIKKKKNGRFGGIRVSQIHLVVHDFIRICKARASECLALSYSHTKKSSASSLSTLESKPETIELRWVPPLYYSVIHQPFSRTFSVLFSDFSICGSI